MKIVGTLGAKTYLADSVDGDEIVFLRKAIPINIESPNAEIARCYVKGTITGKVSTVEVTRQNIVSTQDADEVGPLVAMMMQYLPLAEKQARANTILPELDALMRATAPIAAVK